MFFTLRTMAPTPWYHLQPPPQPTGTRGSIRTWDPSPGPPPGSQALLPESGEFGGKTRPGDNARCRPYFCEVNPVAPGHLDIGVDHVRANCGLQQARTRHRRLLQPLHAGKPGGPGTESLPCRQRSQTGAPGRRTALSPHGRRLVRDDDRSTVVSDSSFPMPPAGRRAWRSLRARPAPVQPLPQASRRYCPNRSDPEVQIGSWQIAAACEFPKR
jgi:hypothetical protein